MSTYDLIDTGEIANITGSKREYVRDVIVKRPDFPKPCLALSQKMKRWKRGDVQQWIETQARRNDR